MSALLVRLFSVTMKAKLFLTVSSLLLGVWMGAGFAAPADPADLDHGLVPPGHGDSHRLGVMEDANVALPEWGDAESGDWSPLLIATAD